MAEEQITSNGPEVAAALQEIVARLSEPRAWLEVLRGELVIQERQVWESQGRVLGVGWPPPADPEEKVNQQLLVATGALRDSLTSEDAGQIEGDSLVFGTDVPYGRFHEYGTSRVPRREFLGISPELARTVVERLLEGL
jgi:hypothetical protein